MMENSYNRPQTLNSYPGDGMGGEMKSEEERWEKEARKVFVGPKNSICLGPFINGYIEGRRKGQEKFNTFHQNINEDQAKLAIYLNLPDDGRMLSEQVIEAFIKRHGEIERLKKKIPHSSGLILTQEEGPRKATLDFDEIE